MSQNWWKVKNLKSKEKEIRSLKISELDLRNDFGSYKKVLETDVLDNSMLEFHNDLEPNFKLLYIKNLLNISHKKNYKILDAGCGMGFTAFQIKNIFKESDVVGIDLSQDAITYAKKKFGKCRFICQGIEPKNGIIDKFDLIFCFEFYPFTRTNDWTTHNEYINYLLKNLRTDGLLIIYQLWTNQDSLSANYSELCIKYHVKLYNTISKKVYTLKSFVPFFILKLIDRLIKLLKRQEAKICVITKKE